MKLADRADRTMEWCEKHRHIILAIATSVSFYTANVLMQQTTRIIQEVGPDGVMQNVEVQELRDPLTGLDTTDLMAANGLANSVIVGMVAMYTMTDIYPQVLELFKVVAGELGEILPEQLSLV